MKPPLEGTATSLATQGYDPAAAKSGIQFGFNAQLTCTNIYKHILKLSNISPLQQKWDVTTGGAIDSSAPAVANGLVYFCSFDHKLYAFNALTGAFQWASLTAGDIHSSPTVANGLVYVGSDAGKLYVFDALTGPLQWTASAQNRIVCSPTISNGWVYVGSWDHKLYAFSLP